VILDLDGAGGRGGRGPRLPWVLPLAAAAVALALIASVNAVPHETAVQETVAPARMETLANLPPAPKVNLTLPADVAVLTARAQYTGETGLLRPGAAVMTYRLRDSNDLVTVSPLPEAPPINMPSAAAAGGLTVHGNYAQAQSAIGAVPNAVRWTERGITYQISSRTLGPYSLAAIAELLR